MTGRQDQHPLKEGESNGEYIEDAKQESRAPHNLCREEGCARTFFYIDEDGKFRMGILKEL